MNIGLGQDYIRGIAYPAFFHREQAPAWIAAVASALGRAAPDPARAHWCEIGCGQGYAAAVLAAANPGMRLTGIDIDPGHVETARARAAAAGLENVDFICGDIRDPDLVAGQFDYIVTHGVLSWVGDAVRSAIADFIARHLAPAGIAAVHYMSEPGGAAFRAFHEVFRSVAHRPDPVAEGLRALRAMRDAGAGFFQLYPHAGQTLDNLLADHPAYVAHEYLNAVFRPLSFREVAALFSAADLGWIGSATPIENIDAVSLPAAAAKAIAPIRETALRETMKDMARNQALRYDLFARPAAPLDGPAHLELLRRWTWRLLPGAPAPGGLVFQTRIGPVDGDARIFRPLLAQLGEGPAGFAELERIQPFTGRPGLLNQALQTLLWSGAAHPVLPVGDPAPSARLNRHLLGGRAQGQAVPALACPALGSGLAFGVADLDALAAGRAGRDLRQLTALKG
ncbi:Methyltransferase domain-containing protein [Paracoccus pantotrophus]|nr:Methyltransferase domain-containing protein [Paracoccus pantotrophus]